MKIWRGFGSEHSANLLLIGRFENAQAATRALEAFERLVTVIQGDFDFDKFDFDEMSAFSEKTRTLLQEMDLYTFSPNDIEHFARDHRVQRQGNAVIIWTDELDVNGFLKFLIGRHARVEIYSAHDYPEERPPLA